MRRKPETFFPPEHVDLADFARALGHPARIAILQVLARRGTCICSEVVDELPLAQSTVSQHLRVLKDAGLIQGEVEGPRVCYCLDPAGLRRMTDALTGTFGDLLACCDDSDACC